MKLAEALQERADLRRKVDMLAERLDQNAFTQEGDEPAEDPRALLEELDATCARLERLISDINRTNSSTLVGGRTITEMLAQKDCLGMRVHVLRDLTSKAGGSRMRMTRSEIRYVRTVDVAELQATADGLAKELRLLDNALQQANWETDLLEGGAA